MLYCERPFRYAHIDYKGQVNICAWNNGAPVGHITDGLEKIWHSEAADDVRRSILDGSFSRCRKDVCPLLMNNRLPERTEGELYTLENLTLPFPDNLSLAYDYICNLSCPSCRKEPIYNSPKAREFLDRVEAELAPYLNKLSYLLIGGHGEPLFSKHSLRLLENLRPEQADAGIGIQTNGTLFTPQLWKRIEHLGDFDLSVIVSIETLNPYVYAKLRRGGNFEALHNNLRFLSQLRQQGKIKSLHSVMVVQALNFMEMPLFAKYCKDLHFDHVNFQPLYNWGTLSEKEYFDNNLLNPMHPHHSFFNKLRDEVIQDPLVNCWNAKTDKRISRWAVTNASQLVILEITQEDIIDIDADFSTLANAIYNRAYLFVLKDGKYYGMMTDKDFYEIWGDPACGSRTAGEVCNQDHIVISDAAIDDIFQDKQKYINGLQTVYPILRDGKLHAKMLVEN